MPSPTIPGRYQYSPLPRGSEAESEVFTIRLLHLLPSADPESPLRCHLIETSIPIMKGAKPPPVRYHALSYTWGDSVFSATLEVVERTDQDGQGPPDRVGISNITENLHSALQKLRKLDEELVLWVDAVCINQSDVAERNSQVTNMPKTYSHASSVIVWLGQDSEGRGYDARAVTFLGDLATLIINLEGNTHSSTSGKPVVINYSQKSWRRRLDVNMMVTGFLEDTGLASLQWFLDRPWFRRRWIIQEVVLAKNVIVHCGPSSISWDALQVAMRELSGNIMGPFTESNRTNMQTVTEMRHMWMHKKDAHPLVTLVKFVHFDCVDPRDRLYALYGVIQKRNGQVDVGIRDVDYTLSTEDLYTKFSSWMLRAPPLEYSSEGVLDSRFFVLQLASAFRQHDLASRHLGYGRPQAMASWIVDWTGTLRFVPLEPPPLHLWNVWAPRGKAITTIPAHRLQHRGPIPIATRQLHNANVLLLAGVAVGVITAVIPLDTEPLLDTGKAYRAKREINNFLGQFARQVHSSTFKWREGDEYEHIYYPTTVGRGPHRDHLVTAIAASLVADWNLTPKNSYFDQAVEFRDDFKEQLANSEYHLPEILHKWPAYVELVALTMRGRSLIVTAQGYIGIAASDACVGDLLCLPEGSTIPFILRPDAKTAVVGDNAVPVPNMVRCGKSFAAAVSEFEAGLMVYTTFQLVSDAYVHCLFKGPPVDPFRRGDEPLSPSDSYLAELGEGEMVLFPII